MQAIKLIKTDEMTHEEWLKSRDRGLGGSDAGAVLGMNPYKSRMQLFLEKTGQMEQPDLSDNEAVYFGNILEDTVAREFSKRTGLKVKKNNYLLQHPSFKFMLANIDREGVEKDETGKKHNFILECKTANAYALSAWEKGVPLHYEAQVLHYLAVTGYRRAYIACLVGGQKFFVHRIDYDWDVIKEVIRAEQDFWENNIMTKTLPGADGSDASAEILAKMYPDATPEKETILDASNQNLFVEIEELKGQKKEIETEINERQNKIKALMTDSEIARCGDFRVSWKTVVSNRFDSTRFKKEHADLYGEYTKKSQSRRFLIN